MTVLVGFVFNMVMESIIYIIAYIPLRTFAGGYHAKTQTLCYVMSSLQIIISLLLIKYFMTNTYCYFFIIVVCVSGIVLIAPVETRNKPLSQSEILVYCNKTRKILTIEFLIAVLCLLLNWVKISKTIFIACFILFLIMLVGKLKN